MTYLLIILLILYCIYNFDINQNKRNKWRWYYFLMFLLILVSGLGYRMGGDGMAYLAEYKSYTIYDGFGWAALTYYPNRMPGWVLLTKLCKCITEDYWLFKLAHATILNTLVFSSLKRFTNMIFTALLFYFILIYFDINFQILRQALSMGLFLYSMRYIENKKWIKYYLCVLLAISFHEGALICLLFPLFLLIRINKKSYAIFIATIILLSIFGEKVIVLIIGKLIPDILMDKTLFYANDTESGGSVTLFNILLAVIIPSSYIYLTRMEQQHKTYYVKIGALLYGLIYVMNFFFPILYRFSYYFQFFFYLIYIELFYRIACNKGFTISHIKENKKSLLKSSGAKNIFLVLVVLFICIRARMYFTPYGDTEMPSWVQYYPYTSIIFQDTDEKREIFIKKLGI